MFGATGFTGRLIAGELCRRGVDVVLAGRNEWALKTLGEELGGRLEIRVGRPDEPETLRGVFEGAGVVINCVGPFARFGEAVLRAAVEQGADYLDTTGEQHYARRVMQEVSSEAEQRGRSAVVAHAFEYAIGECASRIALEETPEAATLHVFTRVEGFGASRGTKKSAIEALASPAISFVNGRLRRERFGQQRARVRFPDEDFDRIGISFAGGEVLSAPRLAPTLRDVRTYLVVSRPAAWLLPAALRLLSPLARRGVPGWLERRIDGGAFGPGEERREHPWWVQARVRAPGGRGTRVTVSGYDAYGTTAAIAALGAADLIGGRAERTGVVTTALAFEPRALLGALAETGVSWRIDPL